MTDSELFYFINSSVPGGIVSGDLAPHFQREVFERVRDGATYQQAMVYALLRVYTSRNPVKSCSFEEFCSARLGSPTLKGILTEYHAKFDDSSLVDYAKELCYKLYFRKK